MICFYNLMYQIFIEHLLYRCKENVVKRHSWKLCLFVCLFTLGHKWVQGRYMSLFLSGKEMVEWKKILFSSFQSLSHVWLFATQELQHARLLCPSSTLGACSNSCPSSQWCHPTISPSVIPFSSCLQSSSASGSFPVSQFFTSGGQIIGASASASVLPVNI